MGLWADKEEKHFMGTKRKLQHSETETMFQRRTLERSLWQKQNGKTLQVVIFAKRDLIEAGKVYSVEQLYIRAVVWGKERIRFHLYGKIL